MVGSAIIRALKQNDVENIVTRTRDELDLCNQAAVNGFFESERPDIVLFAAAKVGGIHANSTYPAEFIYENLMMAANTIHAAHEAKTERFLFLGSACIYPRMAPQPMSENCLLTGPLEETNEAYAIAKIAGLKMCQHYRTQYGDLFHSAMPANLYGPGDNYHPENSHVLPALIYRFHEAKIDNKPEVTVWGTGRPHREFLHVDDLAAGVLHLIRLENPPDLVNVGTGTDIAISDVAEMIADIVGFDGQIAQDETKPDGTPVKRTDISLIQSTGWNPKIQLREGLERTYQDFLDRCKQGLLRQA